MKLPWLSGRYGRGGAYAAAPAAPAGSAKVTRQDDLTAWWKCEDETEEIGDYDLTLNNGAAILSGGATSGSSNALDCDGTNDYAISSAFDLDSGTAISISMWLKSDGAYTAGGNPTYEVNGYYGCAHLTNSTSTLTDVTVGFGQYTSSRMFMWYRMDGGSWTSTTATYYQDAGWDAQDWTLWTMTWASGNTFKLYRNDNSTPVCTSASTVTGTLYDTTSLQFMLAKPPQYSWYMECRWDDIRVYGIELSTSEISDIYNSGSGDW